MKMTKRERNWKGNRGERRTAVVLHGDRNVTQCSGDFQGSLRKQKQDQMSDGRLLENLLVNEFSLYSLVRKMMKKMLWRKKWFFPLVVFP
jgi:hypothetical protein